MSLAKDGGGYKEFIYKGGGKEFMKKLWIWTIDECGGKNHG